MPPTIEGEKAISPRLTFPNYGVVPKDLPAGIVANPANGAIRFETSQVDPSILFQLDKMEVGDISNPMLITTHEGSQAYRILKLNARTKPHKLNMIDDYQKLQEITLVNKQDEALQNWKNKKKAITYVRVADEFRNCTNLNEWISN